MRPTSRLRELLRGDDVIMAPGAYDAITARIIERAGFPAIFITGGGTTMAGLGKPDVGLTTRTQRLEEARAVVDAVEIPTICDVDDGFGNALGVIQTVREFEAVGVAALHLEDQRQPRRCGYLAGGELLSIPEMVGKIHAAVDARRDPDLVIIARCDAQMASSFEEAIERGHAYAAAGADVIFINAMTTSEQFAQAGRAFDKPMLFNVSSLGPTTHLPIGQLRDMGYKIVAYPGISICAAVKTIVDLMHTLKSTGSIASFRDRMATSSDLKAILDYDKYVEQEIRYGGGGDSLDPTSAQA